MFAQALSSKSPASPIPGSHPRTESTASSGRFSEVLTQKMGSDAKVDPVDEENALREMFHILAMLSTGCVDGSAFSSNEAAAGTNAGPLRTQVETLKAVIRRLIRGGRAEDSSDTDPSAKGSDPTLGALFRSLPSEIQNLLRRAFPNLDQLIKTEEQNLNSPSAFNRG